MLSRPLSLVWVAIFTGACAATQAPVVGPRSADRGGDAGARSAADAGQGGWTAYRKYTFNDGSDAILDADGNKAWEISRYLNRNPGYRVAIDGDNPRRVGNVRQALIAAGVPAWMIYSGAYGKPQLQRDERVTVLIGN